MITKNRKRSPGEEEVESDEEALSYDEKVAMVILVKEFHWYSDVRDYMEKTFEWSDLGEDDSELFLDAMIALGKPQDFLCDLMTSIEIHHKDFSNHKSLINDQRAKFYNYFFESSHKASDLALKEYFASFQPSSNSLPFPDSDSKEDKDGETSSQSEENSNICSNTEPEMITRKRKRSPGEEEEESDGSGDIHHPLPPMIFEDEYLLSREDSFMYHDHSKCHLNCRFDDDDIDFDAELFGTTEA